MKFLKLNKLLFSLVAAGLIAASGCKQSETHISKVLTDVFPSTELDREVAYTLYQPPGYSSSDSLHVLYLLHGHGGNHEDWFQEEEGNIASLLDSLINNDIMPPMIAISIDTGNSWYVDSKERMETFYVKEFIPAIEKKLGIAEAPQRIIAGNSAGGYGTLRFSFKYPNLFDEVILLSPAAYEPLPPDVSSSRKTEAFAMNGLFNDSIWNSYSYTHLVERFIASKKRPNFHISVGDDDNYNIVPVVTSLQQLMLQHNVENELRITDGGHDWTCWRRNFAASISSIFENR